MNAIVAVNSDWGIGLRGLQSIVIPEDRRYFQKITQGGIVVAGRETFTQIGGPLPGRTNIVMTKSRDFSAENVIAAHCVEMLLLIVRGEDPGRVFIIGGASIYRLLLPYCKFAYVTKISYLTPSDAYFPDLDEHPDWQIDSVSAEHEYVLSHGQQNSVSNEPENQEIIKYSYYKYKKKEQKNV